MRTEKPQNWTPTICCIILIFTFFLFFDDASWNCQFWAALIHWHIRLLTPLLQTWCSSSTFTSAGSTGSIPTEWMNSAPAEWTTPRTTLQRPRPLSQTNQRGRKRTIKHDPALIFSRGSDRRGKDDLWKLVQGAKWSFSRLMDAATEKKKKETKKLQFNCSLWSLCGSAESPIQCRLGKFLFLFHHPSLPCRFAVQVK